MFRKKQSEIDKLNQRCVELARLLKEKENELYAQRNNNYQNIKEKANLRSENSELKDILKRIKQLITSNQYNNSEALKRKIIELSDLTGNLQITR